MIAFMTGTLGWNGSGKTETVLPGGAGGQAVHVVLSLDPSFIRAGLDPSMLRAIRAEVRTRGGGDVQRTFGRGT
jgi:hypothetical protein